MIYACAGLLLFLCIIALGWLCLQKRRYTTQTCSSTAETPLVVELAERRQQTVRALLVEDAILPRLRHTQRDDVIREILQQFVKRGELDDITTAEADVLQREAQMPTCIGQAIACPHARTSAVKRLTTILAIAPQPVRFDDSADGACQIIILTLMPPTLNSPYMAFITALLTLLGSPRRRHDILNALTAHDVRKALLT